MSALRVDDAIKEDGSRQDIEERRDGQIVAQGQPDEVGAAWPRAGPDGHAVQPAAIDVRHAGLLQNGRGSSTIKRILW